MSYFYGVPIGSPEDSASIAKTDLDRALQVMRPKPSPFPLVRIGGGADGAYLLPDDLKGIKACLSPGVNNAKPFEDELCNRYGIECHMIDASSDIANFATPLIQGKQTFKKLWLDIDGAGNSMSLAAWVDSLGLVSGDDLILQMDIEGAEYRNILATPESVLSRFRIIVLELHMLAPALTRPRVFNSVMRPFLDRLDKQFACVHAHPNNLLGDYLIPGTKTRVPRLLEVTYLRKDRFQSSPGSKKFDALLPHPLDIVNGEAYPPLHLDPSWSGQQRRLISKRKMASDWLNFFRVYGANNLTPTARSRSKSRLKALLMPPLLKRL
jgi:hypothetical protein